MSAPHNQRIIERAKIMWTEEGLSPQQILDQLNYEVRENLLNVPSGTAVPLDKSSINRWADRDKWEPHWRDALAAKNAPASQEEMSVVEQVLYHLAENRGFLLANEYSTKDPFRYEPTEAVLNGVGLQVRRRYGDPMLLSSNDSHPHPGQPTYYGPHSAHAELANTPTETTFRVCQRGHHYAGNHERNCQIPARSPAPLRSPNCSGYRRAS